MSISETQECTQDITISTLTTHNKKTFPFTDGDGQQLSTQLYFGTVSRNPLSRVGYKPGEKTLGIDLSNNVFADRGFKAFSYSERDHQSMNIRQLFRCISVVIDTILEPDTQLDWIDPSQNDFRTDDSMNNKQFRLLEDGRIVVDVFSDTYVYVTMDATSFGQYFVSLMLHGFESASDGQKGTHLKVSDRTVLTSLASGNIVFNCVSCEPMGVNIVDQYFTLSRYDVYSRRVYPCDLQHRDVHITQTIYKGQKVVPVPDQYSSDCDIHWCGLGEPSHANDYSTSQYMFINSFSLNGVELRNPTVQDRTCLQLSVGTLCRAKYMRPIPLRIDVDGLDYYNITMCFPFAVRRFVEGDDGRSILEYPAIVYDNTKNRMNVCLPCYLDGYIATCKGRCHKCGGSKWITIKSREHYMHINGPKDKVNVGDMYITFAYYHSPLYVFGGNNRYVMDDTRISVHCHSDGEAVGQTFVDGAWFIDFALTRYLHDIEKHDVDCSSACSPFTMYIWNVLSYFIHTMNEYGSTLMPVSVEGLPHITHLSPLAVRRDTILCSRMMMFEAFRSSGEFMEWVLAEFSTQYN